MKDIERAVDEEIRHHIAEAADRLVAQGMTPEAARREAERRFGDREAHRAAMMNETRRLDRRARLSAIPGRIASDLRLAARGLMRAPTFAFTLIATLGLGMGAAAAVVTVLDALLLRPLPYLDADRIVGVNRVIGPERMTVPSLAPDQIRRWRELARGLGPLAVYDVAGVTRTNGPVPEMLDAVHVSSGLDEVLGMRAWLGRTFEEGDAVPGVNRAMLGFDYWKGLGLGASAIGSTLRLDGADYEVVGVLPRDFKFPVAGSPPAVWLAIHSDFTSAAGPVGGLAVVARLRDGITLEGAQARMDATSEALARESPDERGWKVSLEPIGKWRGNPEVVRGVWFMAAGVLVMLLVALTNCINLLLFRAVDRARELALRLALGGSRLRLVMQLLAEGVVVGLASGLAAVVIAQALVAGIGQLVPDEFVFSSVYAFRIEHRVLLFTFVLAVACGIVLGLVPGVRVVRSSTVGFDLLKDRGATGRDGALNLLLAGAEIALAVALLVGGGLLANSLLRLTRVDPGFDTDHVAILSLGLPESRYDTPEARAAFFDRVRDGIAALPNVRAVSVSDGVPPWTGFRFGGALQAEGAEPIPPTGDIQLLPVIGATPNFIRTLGARLVRGRDLLPADVGGANVLIDDALARRLWQGDPIGMRFRTDDDAPWQTVVGVFAHMASHGLDDRTTPYTIVRPRNPARAGAYMSLAIRTAGDPHAVMGDARRVVKRLDPELAIWRFSAATEALAGTIDKPRFLAAVMVAMSVVALVLAAVGIYGVLACAVTRRRREIGIRIALGAAPAAVRRSVIARGLAVAVAGIIVGLAAGQALTRLVRSLLFGVQPADPATLAIVAIVVAAVAALASFIPARRATRLDPVEVLRAE